MIVTRWTKPIAMVVILTLSTMVVGCGGDEIKGVPVSGKVMMGAEPANTGSVAFHPDGSKGNKDTNLYNGSINEQGQFSVTNKNGKEAVPEGWYKVTVNVSVPSDPKDPYSESKSLIDKKFEDPTATPLSVEVKKDAAPGSYELKVTK